MHVLLHIATAHCFSWEICQLAVHTSSSNQGKCKSFCHTRTGKLGACDRHDCSTSSSLLLQPTVCEEERAEQLTGTQGTRQVIGWQMGACSCGWNSVHASKQANQSSLPHQKTKETAQVTLTCVHHLLVGLSEYDTVLQTGAASGIGVGEGDCWVAGECVGGCNCDSWGQLGVGSG